MTPWITITAADLDGHMAGKMISALLTKALAAGQGNPFDEHWPNVAMKIRSKIQAGGYIVSATPLAIPPELKEQACILVIERLSARLPGLDIDENFRKLIDRAYTEIDDAGKGLYGVSEPTDPLSAPEVQGSGTIQVVVSTPLQTRRNRMGGL